MNFKKLLILNCPINKISDFYKSILIILFSLKSILVFSQFDKNPDYSIKVQNFEDSISISIPHGWKLNYQIVDTMSFLSFNNNMFFKWDKINQKQIFWIEEDLYYSSQYKGGKDESFHLSIIDSSEIHKIKQVINVTSQDIDTIANGKNELYLKYICGPCETTCFVTLINHNDILYLIYMDCDYNDDEYYQKYYEQMLKSLKFYVR